MDSDWKFDRFHDGSYKSAEDNVIKKYEQFLTDFSQHLDIQVDVMEGYGTTNIDSFFDPIELVSDHCESTTLLALVNSDNKILNKIVVTFATICLEMNSLSKEARLKFIPALTFYGEGMDHNQEDSTNIPVAMGRFLPTLQNIMCFINRIYDVIKHAMQQLAGLYSKSSDDSYLCDLSNIHFEELYTSIAHLLFHLITFDELFTSSSAFKDDWEAYKKVLTTAKHDTETYGLVVDKLQPFETMLMNLEGKLMQGHIFINCCIQNFDDHASQATNVKNSALAAIFNRAIKNRFLWLSSKIDSSVFLETNEREEFVGWCGLYGLYITIFGNADKKLFKDIVSFHNKLPVLPLPGNRVWYPLTFLKNCIPYLSKFVDPKQAEQIRSRQRSYLQERTGANFARDLAGIYQRLVPWCVAMENDLRRQAYTTRSPQRQASTLVTGIQLANKSRILCQTVLQLHANLGQSLTRTTGSLICRGLEFAKLVEAVVRRQRALICDMLEPVVHATAERVLLAAGDMKAHLKAQIDKSLSRRQLDVTSALSLIEAMLSGAATAQRRVVIQLAVSIIRPEDLLKDEDYSEFRAQLRQYEILSDFFENVRLACDCTFFYWARDSVFPCYLENIFKGADNVCHLQFILAALRDSVRGLLASAHLADRLGAVRLYEREVLELLEQKLLVPICKSVENDLRVQMYSHILGTRSELNPFTGSGDIVVSASSSSSAGGGGPTAAASSTAGGGGSNPSGGSAAGARAACAVNLVHFVKARPIRFFDRHIRIKDYVEHHLETAFYNLTAIYLSDWRNYAEMQRLAQNQYGLCVSTPDMHLPSQSLEQGRDVLNIMRGMAQFSAHYVYNLNTQVFVEKQSDNKFLNTVNIRHVANSVRTHGWGIINTTINNAYVFLKDKFYQFSEFLFDERIKGKLIKELHEFKERAQMTDKSQYQYQNAEQLRAAIRKMLVYADGTNSLDRFRNHITKMGNAMAFVRSVRSGALHCGSSSANFFPDEEVLDTSFEELARDTGLSAETEHSARNVDHVIRNLSSFFEKDKDYFKMFVDVFAIEFRTKKNIHCHNFFVLLPALTLSFVEHIMECKDKFNRKNKDVFIFSDDGFAIGVAYILKVLDLYKQFDSLHWFKAVYAYYDAKLSELQKSLAAVTRSDDNLRQTQTLSLRRLEQSKGEFQLLEYSITSARIFFRADLTAEEERQAQLKRDKSSQAQQAAPLVEAS